MANNTAKYGFRFHKTVGGSGHPFLMRLTVATGYDGQDDSANSVNLNIGDPVNLASTGGLELASADEAVFGVIQGFGYYWDGTVMKPTDKLPNQNAWGTNETRRPWVSVCPAWTALWEADVDENTTATTFAAYLAFLGENTEHTCAGDTANLTALPELDISDHATTAGLAWRLVDISQTAENRDFSGENVKLIVTGNENQWGGMAATPVTGI